MYKVLYLHSHEFRMNIFYTVEMGFFTRIPWIFMGKCARLFRFIIMV